MNDEKTSRLILMNSINLLIKGYMELGGNLGEAVNIMEFVTSEYKTKIEHELTINSK